MFQETFQTILPYMPYGIGFFVVAVSIILSSILLTRLKELESDAASLHRTVSELKVWVRILESRLETDHDHFDESFLRLAGKIEENQKVYSTDGEEPVRKIRFPVSEEKHRGGSKST
jgi:hypothetical protein